MATVIPIRKVGALIFIGSRDSSNPIVACPFCGMLDRLLNGFSYLKGGFNGIRNGDPDDLDMQECGGCKALLEE